MLESVVQVPTDSKLGVPHAVCNRASRMMPELFAAVAGAPLVDELVHAIVIKFTMPASCLSQKKVCERKAHG